VRQRFPEIVNRVGLASVPPAEAGSDEINEGALGTIEQAAEKVEHADPSRPEGRSG